MQPTELGEFEARGYVSRRVTENLAVLVFVCMVAECDEILTIKLF